MKTILSILCLTVSSIAFSQDTTFTYFNTDWDIVQQGEDTVYYRKAIKESNHYTILDYYINDTLQMHGVFSNHEDEIHHGQFSFYYQSGNIQCSGLYQNNKKEGIWKYYDDTTKQTIKKKGGFLQGKKEGIWEYYNNKSDSYLAKTINFKSGNKHGIYTEYTPQEDIYTQGKYDDKKMTGTWLFYNKAGKITSKELYENDSLIKYTFFDKNGKKIKNNPPYKKEILVNKEQLSFQKYIRKEIKYPTEAVDRNIQGNVYISFTIQKNGTISNIKLKKENHELLNKEAIRLIRSIEKVSIPYAHNRISKMKMTLPIFFKLN